MNRINRMLTQSSLVCCTIKCAHILCVLVVLAATCTYLNAQLDVGSIQGRVTDSSGAVVPGAKVLANSVDSSSLRNTTTNGDGVYSLPSLKPGEYLISIDAKGFSTSELRINLVVGQTASGNVTLEIGSTSTSVVVNASSAQVQTDSHEVSSTIGQEAISELPTGESVLAAAVLGPGSQAATDSVQNQGSSVFFGVVSKQVVLGGGLSSQTDFLQDGNENVLRLAQAANIVASTEDTQEVKTIVNGADARYRDPSVVNVITKRGTNAFHGAVYDFLENDAFNARNYNLSGAAQPKTPVRYNLFGVDVGWPLWPRKLFFLFDYTGSRDNQSSFALARVPTQAELTGDFSAYSQLIYDPATYNPLTETTKSFSSETGSNSIPVSRLNPFFTKYLAFFPAANIPLNPIQNVNYQKTLTTTSPSDQYQGRLDWDISQNHKLSGSVLDANSPTTSPSIVPNLFGNTYESSGFNAFIEDTYVFGPTLVNTFRVGYNRGIQFESELGVGSKNWASYFGLSGLDAAPTQWAPPPIYVADNNISVSGNQYAPQGATQNLFEYADEVNYIRGRHALFFGAQLVRTQFDGNWTILNNGSYNFNGVFTAQYEPGPSGPVENPSNQGLGIADLFLGLPSIAQGATGTSVAAFREYDGYAQDNWRLRPNLTLNLGVRYQFDNPPNDTNGHSSIYDLPSNTTIPGTWNTNYNDWSPRLGFAYSPRPDISVHGGYGIYFSNASYNFLQFLIAHAPTLIQQTQTFTITTPTPIQSAIIPNPPATGQSPQTLAKQEPDFNIQQWNLFVDKSFARNYLASIGYVGASENHESVRLDANQANGILPGSTAGKYDKRPHPYIGEVFEQSNIGYGNYNALFASLNRQFSHGAEFQASYTWSKAMDITTSDGLDIENLYKLRDSYAPSSFDRTNQITFSGLYQLPFGTGQRYLNFNNFFAREVIGGWHASAIYRVASGLPVLVGANNNANTSINVEMYAQKSCDANSFHHTKAEWYNTSCFSQPGPYQYGIGGRNSAREPGIDRLDFSLNKVFVTFHEQQIEFRADYFNILNHPQYLLPGAVNVNQTDSQGTPNYAAVSGSLGMRSAEFALKYSF
jgi:hypothetical protein